ncbi:hypothetical protein [Blastochloris viridis]|uniref:hypothetical protein n=1 Tax=Blastochloris viridis TaxID=1079 RepID=UPI00119CA009|nr:hypothetical protein [Blastochloris viridis]
MTKHAAAVLNTTIGIRQAPGKFSAKAGTGAPGPPVQDAANGGTAIRTSRFERGDTSRFERAPWNQSGSGISPRGIRRDSTKLRPDRPAKQKLYALRATAPCRPTSKAGRPAAASLVLPLPETSRTWVPGRSFASPGTTGGFMFGGQESRRARISAAKLYQRQRKPAVGSKGSFS